MHGWVFLPFHDQAFGWGFSPDKTLSCTENEVSELIGGCQCICFLSPLSQLPFTLSGPSLARGPPSIGFVFFEPPLSLF
jgi:hypothetical protein